MKPVGEWEEGDLWALVQSRAQESNALDFKQSAKLNRQNDGRLGLSKMVSSLANAGGGILVFGIVEDKHFAVDIDGGLDPNEITKETIDQLISTTIQPKVEGVTIKQIWLSGERQGRVAYAIEVPQARTRAPHQASDSKYYKRSNFESVPMADYEIRDALRRATTPALFLDFALGPERATADGIAFEINVMIGNESAEPALYWITGLLFDAELQVSGLAGFTPNGEVEARFGEHRYKLNRSTKNAGVPGSLPMFKEAKFHVATINVEAGIDRAYGLGYSLACPGFSIQRAAVLSTLNGRPRLEWID